MPAFYSSLVAILFLRENSRLVRYRFPVAMRQLLDPRRRHRRHHRRVRPTFPGLGLAGTRRIRGLTSRASTTEMPVSVEGSVLDGFVGGFGFAGFSRGS